MPYEIDVETRTLSDPSGDAILTAANQPDLDTLSLIADAANGSPSGQTNLIFAPDIKSFIDVQGDISIMLSGVEDISKGLMVVGLSNHSGVLTCTPSSHTAITAAPAGETLNWYYLVDQQYFSLEVPAGYNLTQAISVLVVGIHNHYEDNLLGGLVVEGLTVRGRNTNEGDSPDGFYVEISTDVELHSDNAALHFFGDPEVYLSGSTLILSGCSTENPA